MGFSLSKLFTGPWTKKEIRILMVGLDCAGRTTILYQLKHGKFVQTHITVGVHFEDLEYKDIRFTFLDVGGQNVRRPMLNLYFRGVGGLIFVVDSNDRDRIFQARDDLQLLLNEEELRDAILLVLANKQDLPNAMNAAEIADNLGLHSHHHRPWHIQSTCATTGEGLREGLDWLATKLA